MTSLTHIFSSHQRRDFILITILVIWLTNYSPVVATSDPNTDRPQAATTTTDIPNSGDLQSSQSPPSSPPPLTSDYSVDPSPAPVQETASISTLSMQSSLATVTTQQPPDMPDNASNTTIEIIITTTTTTTTTTTAPPVTTTTPPPGPQTFAPTISQQPQPHCTLGDDIFQIGERWNPNLPPFGVQVCVLCECTVRQRKSCYEAKVTCRRITNECPVIDSCPDGKKPVTVAGQCCKSCQSTTSLSVAQQQQESNFQVQQQQPQTINNQSPAYESQQPAAAGVNQTPLKIVYMNERTKEYLSMVKSLPQCPSRDESRVSSTSSSPPSSATIPGSKGPKGSRNDLNGIDTRLAFKSLHDSATNQLSSSSSSANNKDSSMSSSSRRVEQHHSDQDHHQHPNDVQSASSSNSNNNQQAVNYGRSKQQQPHQTNTVAQPSPTNCLLGNDTFQVGDVWNPILPPFGVQLCVQCKCIYRVRKGCYETKVTCRRVSRDCPKIDECPDGKPPVVVSGQCCKSCPTLLNNIVQETQQQLGATISPTMPLDGIQRNEKVSRDFAAVSRNMDVCVRARESVDIYNTNRYARRSQKA